MSEGKRNILAGLILLISFMLFGFLLIQHWRRPGRSR